MRRILNLILFHQSADFVDQTCEWWYRISPPEQTLVIHGGKRDIFDKIKHSNKLHIPDVRRETKDHQRERQSYTRIFQEVAGWSGLTDFSHIFLAEYDLFPLTEKFHDRLLERIEEEQADILGHEVMRTDRTSHPMYLYHAAIPGFHEYWKSISIRRDQRTIISMFGNGSLWTRQAFQEVGKYAEPFPMYLETYLPTLAHHLGFRIRDFKEQSRFIYNLHDRTHEIPQALESGAWMIHPIKKIPQDIILR
jgi:hypothetical protein